MVTGVQTCALPIYYDVPAACFSLNGPISGGTIAGCSFSGITLQSATVEFYKVSQSGNPTLSSLTWNAGNAGAITLATFGGGQLKGVVTSIFDPLPGPPTSGFNTVDDYSWVLDFQSGANGTSVARLGFGTVVCDDDSCSSRSTRLIRSFEAECEFRILGWNTEGNPTVKFGNPVPEPQTYILMLAGLTALGFVNRRRRQRSG